MRRDKPRPHRIAAGGAHMGDEAQLLSSEKRCGRILRRCRTAQGDDCDCRGDRPCHRLTRYAHDHSALTLANLMTPAHLSVSSPMSLPKFAGEPPSRLPPRSVSRAFIFASTSAALIAWLSFSMISA